MIHIAVCDDADQDLQHTVQLLSRYGALHPEHELSVSAYPSPEQLLADFDGGALHDIYLLDLLMPRMSGLQLGQQLRSHNSGCCIVFCTVSPEHAQEARRIQAQNYLLKPLEEQALFHTLDACIQWLKQEQSNGIRFRTSEGLAFLPYHRISYIELEHRRMVFHLTDHTTQTSLVLRGSFEQALSTLLAEPRFVQAHKSFVVNMASVRLYSDCKLTMDDGCVVPISVRKQAAVFQRYFSYLSSVRCDGI